MKEKPFKRRKVRDFFENILRSFGTIFLGAIMVMLIFIVIYIIKDRLHEARVVYSAVMEVKPTFSQSEKVKEDLDVAFKKMMESEKVEKALKKELAIDIPYDEFMEYVTVRTKNNRLVISFEEKDESYGKIVVAKLFNVTAYEFMKEYPIESFEIVSAATYKVDATNRDWTSHSFGWFMMMGAFIGGGLTLAIVCMFYLLDNTIRDEQDVREYLELPVLTVIPVDKQVESKNGGGL